MWFRFIPPAGRPAWNVDGCVSASEQLFDQDISMAVRAVWRNLLKVSHRRVVIANPQLCLYSSSITAVFTRDYCGDRMAFQTPNGTFVGLGSDWRRILARRERRPGRRAQ